ncbi:MAG: ATP-binding cassette domain-containing protein [Bacteroidaceae bacterium]|nr:ATP-binding cassette domain-containing protein [Bacteroidaceae bacterium]
METRKSTWGLLYRFMKAGNTLLWLVFLLYTITIGMELFPPFFQQIYTDDIITGKNPGWFEPLLWIYGGLFLLELTAWLVLNSHRRTLTMQFSLVSQSRYVWHVLRLPLSSFRRFSTGDLMARFMGISRTGVKLFDQAPGVILLFNVLIFSYLLFFYSWRLGLIELLALATIIFSVRLSSDYQKRKAKSMEATERRLQSATMSGMRNMETIKSAGAEQGFYQRWDAIYSQALNARVTATRQMILMAALPIFVQQLSNAVVLCLGAMYILDGDLTPGMLLASQAFMTSMLYPVTKISTVMQEVFKAHSVLERQEEVLDCNVLDVQQLPADTGTVKLRGEIELRDVTFGYDRSLPPQISHLSLHIMPGEHVAFVGRSGCGKSTILMLVAGLYEPWEGEVLIDGIPVNRINRMILTGSLGFVSQDVTIFQGTVADNIRMWDASISDYAVETASVNAQIHDELSARPDAYQTVVGTGGNNFSGGQCQRMEIAAALAKEPTLLLMDEATSALDRPTEERLMQSVCGLGITLLVIAHRLESIQACDRIYVMDYGHLVQSGTHDSLMADRDGIYYQLNSYGNVV